MEDFVRRLPKEIEDKTRDYVLSDSVKLALLLDKHPLTNDLFAGFTKKQLDKVYRFACLDHILPRWFSGYNTPCTILEKVWRLFSDNDEGDPLVFAEQCMPNPEINKYWKYGKKIVEPTNEMYIDGMIKFCNYILEFPRLYKNKHLQNYCDKIVYQMIICVLIIRGKNNTALI